MKFNWKPQQSKDFGGLVLSRPHLYMYTFTEIKHQGNRTAAFMFGAWHGANPYFITSWMADSALPAVKGKLVGTSQTLTTMKRSPGQSRLQESSDDENPRQCIHFSRQHETLVAPALCTPVPSCSFDPPFVCRGRHWGLFTYPVGVDKRSRPGLAACSFPLYFYVFLFISLLGKCSFSCCHGDHGRAMWAWGVKQCIILMMSVRGAGVEEDTQ